MSPLGISTFTSTSRIVGIAARYGVEARKADYCADLRLAPELPAEANRELDDARRHFSRRSSESIEVLRRVKGGSLEVRQRQGLSVGTKVQAR